MVRVPFGLGRDHLIVVDARINGHGPFDFVVDTGASLTVLSLRTARTAGVKRDGRRVSARGAGLRMPARIARLRALDVGAIHVTNLSVAILDLTSLDHATGLRVGGIIGYNLLKRYRITIDYQARCLLFRPAQPASASKPTSASARRR